jgi:hypothetical protein
MSHARERGFERYGKDFHLQLITATIREGKAKFVSFARSETGVLRQIYDVPYATPDGAISVRVIVNEETKFVISVLPPEFQQDAVKRNRKERQRDGKQVKKKFFRDFEDDDAEEAVA